ncbi:MAG: thymidine phosphorylase [Candidatus Omnitrophota bacterium]
MNVNSNVIHNIYEIISKKRDGNPLTTDEIEFFIHGYVNGDIPDYQASALLMAIYIRGLTSRELTDLTRIMMQSGDLISLESVDGTKIDKHSTGGVGDKISFIVAPLVAACGVKVPMLSGRGLGHTGGTLDKLESIPGFNVFLQPARFKETLKNVGMVICGQTENIVPADRKLYALRDVTATVTSIPLISASIMSKKLALGTDGIVLDVKTGSGAFMRRIEDSIELCKTMVDIGENSNRKTIGLITGMDQPLGNAVGNSLEIIESIEALKGNGPADVMEVTFGLGAAMLVAAGVETDYRSAIEHLEKVLKTHQPLEIFQTFIAAQGGDERVCENYLLFPQVQYRTEFLAEKDGFISKINAFEVGMAALDIGAGRKKKEENVDHSCGFMFNKKVGHKVNKGDSILTIYANDTGLIETARTRLQRAITISNEKTPENKIIRYVIDKTGVTEWMK